MEKLTARILEVVESAAEPLTTVEISMKADTSREKALVRLMDLLSMKEIESKKYDVANGLWLWWRKGAFDKSGEKRNG